MGNYKRKHRISVLATTCLFFVGLLTGSAQFMDDFTDGDFTNTPTWNGDASLFTAYQVNSTPKVRVPQVIISAHHPHSLIMLNGSFSLIYNLALLEQISSTFIL